MKDLWHSLIKITDHDRHKMFGIVLALLIAGWVAGCNAKTLSVTGSGEQVTQTQFTREVAAAEANLTAQAETLAANAQEGQADLDRQNALRAKIINTVGAVATAATTGTLNPAAGVGSLVAVLLAGVAGGSVMDSRRKDKLINDLKP